MKFTEKYALFVKFYIEIFYLFYSLSVFYFESVCFDIKCCAWYLILILVCLFYDYSLSSYYFRLAVMHWWLHSCMRFTPLDLLLIICKCLNIMHMWNSFRFNLHAFSQVFQNLIKQWKDILVDYLKDCESIIVHDLSCFRLLTTY